MQQYKYEIVYISEKANRQFKVFIKYSTTCIIRALLLFKLVFINLLLQERDIAWRVINILKGTDLT